MNIMKRSQTIKAVGILLASSIILTACFETKAQKQENENSNRVVEQEKKTEAVPIASEDNQVKNKNTVPAQTQDNNDEQREIKPEQQSFYDLLPEELKKELKDVDFQQFNLDKDNPKQIVDVDSPYVLASKSSYFPENYKPKNLTIPNIPFSFTGNNEKKNLQKPAADAITELINGAAKENISISGVSGYRSIARQKVIYKYNVDNYGQSHADKYSAKPMYSEHHTGLCMDVSSASVKFDLVEKYGDTKEGKWLAENAHKYGFIIRYPKGKEEITGYNYEPWHIRYLGVPLATYLYENALTYEEFLAKMQEKPLETTDKKQ